MSLGHLYIDLETASSIPIDYGVWRYCEDVRVLLLAYAWDDEPVTVLDWSPEIADWLPQVIRRASRVIAHNAEFDFTVLSHVGIQVPLQRQYCTMEQARRHGLPGGLEKLSQVFKLPEDEAKARDGRKLIQLFCKPQKDGTWKTKDTHPEEWARFKHYAGQDIVAMRRVHQLCPKWNDEVERDIWMLDSVINARGFAVDRHFANSTVTLLKLNSTKLDADMAEKSDGWVERGTQRDRLLEHLLAEHGVDLPDLTASTLERRLKDNELPEAVKQLLRIRLESARTSTTKYATLLNCVNDDGRLRGSLIYCGAGRTGRWAGTKFQPHNLPRQVLPPYEIEFITRALSAQIPEVLDESVSRCASEAVRGAAVAAPGHRLLVADYANIEGRVVAWLADERWKLDAFRAYDEGSGPDLYKLAYARAFACVAEGISKTQRQIGKVLELMMGYGGGVGAFVTGAATYRIDLEEMAEACWPSIPREVQIEAEMFYARQEEDGKTYGLTREVFCACDGLKRLWRRANPRIAALWGEVQSTFANCHDGGRAVTVGRCEFDRVGSWTRIRLPSGRYLCYPSVKVDRDGSLSFLGVSPYTRQWGRIRTWGGTLVENITQAVARDVLCCGLMGAQSAGLSPVLHVHDEIVCEVPEESSARPEDLVWWMTEVTLSWTEGLPLAAEGFETRRYRKAA